MTETLTDATRMLRETRDANRPYGVLLTPAQSLALERMLNDAVAAYGTADAGSALRVYDNALTQFAAALLGDEVVL